MINMRLNDRMTRWGRLFLAALVVGICCARPAYAFVWASLPEPTEVSANPPPEEPPPVLPFEPDPPDDPLDPPPDGEPPPDVSTAPEPASLAMGALGIAIAAAVKWRRRRK